VITTLQDSFSASGLLDYSLKSDFVRSKLVEISKNESIQKVKSLNRKVTVKGPWSSGNLLDDFSEVVESEELAFVMRKFNIENKFNSKSPPSNSIFMHIFRINFTRTGTRLQEILPIQMAAQYQLLQGSFSS
jgi:hypothetical protein